jgi:5-enolpyruvylshikimate-3-phosphate synthase
MAFTLVALGASGNTVIDSAESVAVSYPTFLSHLQQLAR